MSVSDTGFEGGDDGRGHGDYIFLVRHGQPSHNVNADLDIFGPPGVLPAPVLGLRHTTRALMRKD